MLCECMLYILAHMDNDMHVMQGVTKRPIAPSNMSPNAEGGGELRGLSQPMSAAVHRSPNKFWRSNYIFNL
jgi:hypothetical protein